MAAALREAGVDATVELGMRYGNPSIPDAIGWLRAQGCERILTCRSIRSTPPAPPPRWWTP